MTELTGIDRLTDPFETTRICVAGSRNVLCHICPWWGTVNGRPSSGPDAERPGLCFGGSEHGKDGGPDVLDPVRVQFVSVVSHDLRNPLNVANGRLELAMEDGERSHIETAAAALDRMETLIVSVLTPARAGDSVGEMDPVDLAELGWQCWDNVETKSARLSADSDAVIRRDESRLQQLVENLFRNAVEHGGEDVRVTVGEVDRGFYVEDDGPGIPEAYRDAVFEAGYFSREAGTGFGLSIVKDIVEARDWSIRVVTALKGALDSRLPASSSLLTKRPPSCSRVELRSEQIASVVDR